MLHGARIALTMLCGAAVARAQNGGMGYFDAEKKPTDLQHAVFVRKVTALPDGHLLIEYFDIARRGIASRESATSLDPLLLDGAAEYHREDGSIEERGTYDRGRRDGTWERWHPNGIKASEISYRAGAQDGSFATWYDNGQQRESGSYRAGKPVGPWKEWYRSGELSGSGEIPGGVTPYTMTYYHRNGSVSAVVTRRETTVLSAAYTDEEGSPQPDSAKANHGVIFSPGGKDINRFIAENLRYPEEAQRSGMEGKAVVRLLVAADGMVLDRSILRADHPTFAVEALRVSKLLTRATPARRFNHDDEDHYDLTISFVMVD